MKELTDLQFIGNQDSISRIEHVISECYSIDKALEMTTYQGGLLAMVQALQEQVTGLQNEIKNLKLRLSMNEDTVVTTIDERIRSLFDSHKRSCPACQAIDINNPYNLDKIAVEAITQKVLDVTKEQLNNMIQNELNLILYNSTFKWVPICTNQQNSSNMICNSNWIYSNNSI